MDKNTIWILVINMVENLAIIAAATLTAIYFSRPALLAWMLLVLLNSMTITTKQKGKQEGQ